MVDLTESIKHHLKTQKGSRSEPKRNALFRGESEKRVNSTKHSPDGLAHPDVTSAIWTFSMNPTNGCSCQTASITCNSLGVANFFFETATSNIDNYYYIHDFVPYDQNGQSLELFALDLGGFGVNTQAGGAYFPFSETQYLLAFIFPFIDHFEYTYSA